MASILSIEDPDVIDWYFEISSNFKSTFFLVVLPFTKKTYLFELGTGKKKELTFKHILQNFKTE